MMHSRNRGVFATRTLLIIVLAVVGLLVVWAWVVQLRTTNVCQVGFDHLQEHNGYVEIDLIRQHPTEELFEGELFLYYPDYQNPPARMTIRRSASGCFAASIVESALLPWSKGKAFPRRVQIDFPTPGMSHRRFPFDSPHFDFTLAFDPPIRPSVVRVVNRTDAFVSVCNSVEASWLDSGVLTVRAQLRRNPFVQVTLIVLGIGAAAFAILLARLKSLESLATGTASYFLSLWSLRGIVDRTILSFPTLLDMWLLTLAVIVLSIVSWRLIDLGSKQDGGAA